MTLAYFNDMLGNKGCIMSDNVSYKRIGFGDYEITFTHADAKCWFAMKNGLKPYGLCDMLLDVQKTV